MEELKKLLGDELSKQVSEKLGDKKLLLLDDGRYIPYERFQQVVSERNTLQERIAKAEKDMEELAKMAKGSKELEDRLKQLQEENKKFQDEFVAKEQRLKKEIALKEALLNEGVFDSEARELLLKKFDIDKIELENDKIKGWNELLKPIKESKTLSLLFGKIEPKGKNAYRNNAQPVADFISKEEVMNMSQEEVNQSFETILKSMPHWNK